MYYSSNSFPQLTSSTHSHGHANILPPLFFPHHTSHETFLHPNNILQDPSSNNIFPANINSDSSPFIFENVSDLVGSTSNMATLLKEDHPHCDPLGYSITSKKTRSKKDRHSLIFTAQGLRHRRVRLSIDIAHKFFNLQDMLGFDKASQTLDWLFTNSKTAIQQLMEFSNYPNSSSTSSHECDEGMLNSKIHETHVNEKKSRSLGADHFIAKESREKARARARERTRKKQRIRKLDEEFKKQIPHYHNLISSSNSIRSSSENAMPFLPFSGISLINETPWKDIIVEAILNKKPLKSPPIYEYQKNLPVSEEIKFQSELFSHY